jgi:hypothetical protein
MSDAIDPAAHMACHSPHGLAVERASSSIRRLSQRKSEFMVLTLRLLLAALGLAAVCICLSILLYGPANTASSFEALFNALTGLNYPVTGAWPPTMDSELRFYAPLWGGYGLILIAVARNLRAMLHYVPLLAATFFVGGAGRALSYFQVGPPHPFFVFLMVIELGLPIIFLMLWFRIRSQVA